MKRTTTPEAFIYECERALDAMRSGRGASMSAHYEPNGIGRVNVVTVDGQDVDDPCLPTTDATLDDDTSPGKGQRKR